MVIGPVNGGWRLITEQLNHERIGLAAMTYGANACYDDVIAWAAECPAGQGGRVIDQCWVQSALGECFALLQAIGLMGDRVAWEVAQGTTRPELAGGLKVFGTEGVIKVMRLLLDVLGPVGLIRDGSAGAVLRGRVEHEFRKCQINTFGGGAAEVLRDMVAKVGLGIPRASRQGDKNDATRSADPGSRIRRSARRTHDRCARSRKPADDPSLVRSDGRNQPDIPRRRGRAGRRVPQRGCPPAMLDVWTMEPYNPVVERVGDHPVFDLLTEAGFSGIVATNVEQEYDRYLECGDLVHMTARVQDVSEEKQTALGTGHFVTLWYEFTDQAGTPIGRILFRLFKFKPKPAKPASRRPIPASRRGL